ncbi:MAG: hypothetical protein GF416_08130 [Candidatus Altiarchaeales archaeon]|nr:hypothetical protein [Candidatus Altiarchaeales archaeon]MBD3417082.1 hypothetical protein [Candidatus Altiarchaeales archaeon]
MKIKSLIAAYVLFAIILFSTYVTAPSPAGTNYMKDVVCSILSNIQFVLDSIGPGFVIVMFTYGGIKYVFSADDPQGRKSAKNTCIHSLIGGIILIVAHHVVGLLGMTNNCTGTP